MRSTLSKLATAAVIAASGVAVELMRRAVAKSHAGTAGAYPRSAGETPIDVETASREQLYGEAKRRGVKGRSKMTKAELRSALSEGGPE